MVLEKDVESELNKHRINENIVGEIKERKERLKAIRTKR
jgi:hypothetical protein